MAYITRQDGEHFVIPSYRDVLVTKNKSTLKKDILLLSQNYGEYITLQRKSATQYEVAFSSDTGYLLGESIWHHFKRPQDMIYCEAIPNTTEALLVIVKSGSVYLDGSFSIDSIPEELIIFLTQQNHFEIYIYGDVPITDVPTSGKFSFEPSSVKSFTFLPQPVFPTLRLLKAYQLQLVDPVLKAHGIGVFPVRKLLIAMSLVGLMWIVWSYVTREPTVVAPVSVVDPMQPYIDALTSPAPNEQIKAVVAQTVRLMTIPGWSPKNIKYAAGTLTAIMQSNGNKMQDLLAWADQNKMAVTIKPDGVYLSIHLFIPSRAAPVTIYPLKQVIAQLVDQLATIYPGNHLQLNEFINKGVFTMVNVTISMNNASPMLLTMMGEQFKALPFVLTGITLDINSGSLTGSITLDALGN